MSMTEGKGIVQVRENELFNAMRILSGIEEEKVEKETIVLMELIKRMRPILPKISEPIHEEWTGIKKGDGQEVTLKEKFIGNGLEMQGGVLENQDARMILLEDGRFILQFKDGNEGPVGWHIHYRSLPQSARQVIKEIGLNDVIISLHSRMEKLIEEQRTQHQVPSGALPAEA